MKKKKKKKRPSERRSFDHRPRILAKTRDSCSGLDETRLSGLTGETRVSFPEMQSRTMHVLTPGSGCSHCER